MKRSFSMFCMLAIGAMAAGSPAQAGSYCGGCGYDGCGPVAVSCAPQWVTQVQNVCSTVYETVYEQQTYTEMCSQTKVVYENVTVPVKRTVYETVMKPTTVKV